MHTHSCLVALVLALAPCLAFPGPLEDLMPRPPTKIALRKGWNYVRMRYGKRIEKRRAAFALEIIAAQLIRAN